MTVRKGRSKSEPVKLGGNTMFEFEENVSHAAKIKVIGVGGGGGNAVKTMIRSNLSGVEFLIANTDLQALKTNDATVKIQLGAELTRGLGAGSNPEMGRNSALEDVTTIEEALRGTDMVFVTAGMGGGTGTGAAPIIARIAREEGALVVGVVTKPFAFEGKKRMRQAEQGIEELRKEVDTLITIPNEKLLFVANKETPILDTFKMADNVLLQAVKGISDLILIPGLINLDFADVRAIMRETGMALMGTGVAAGENRAIEAARKAIASPLLENVSVNGATGILLNITGSSGMTLFEVNEASKLIQEEAHEDANIIFGAVIDDRMKDEIRVTVIATGFNKLDDHREVRVDERRAQTSASRSWAASSSPFSKARTPSKAPALEERADREMEEERSFAPLGRRSAVREEESAPYQGNFETLRALSVDGREVEVTEPTREASRFKHVKERDETDFKKIAAEIGINGMEDEYDVPAFIRRRAD